MTYTTVEDTLGLRYPMPSAALAPLAWYLGVHMLKCLQEAGKTTTMTCGRTTVPLPTEDKTTQIDIFSKKIKEKENTQDKKIPAKIGRRPEKTDIPKKQRGRKSESDIRPDSIMTKCDSMHRESKSETKKHGTSDKEALSKSRSKDQTTSSRRFSTGSCPKRTSEAPTETVMTEWLMNPVFTSIDGDRTDRSEMSLPWQDISKAKEEKEFEESMPRLAVKSFAENVQRHVPVRVRPTQPTMEPVHEAPRDLNLRPRSGTSRMPTPTDLFVQEVVKRRLGRSLADMDTASLKSISRERVKQLAEKYHNGDRPRAPAADSTPASVLAQQALRARDSADSMYVRVDPQRGR